MARLKSVSPISDEDTNALPVKNLGMAISFYQSVLGFSVVSHSSPAAILTRDEVRIGLLWKIDHEPGKAGSLAFEVDELEAMHRELEARGGKPGEFGIDEHTNGYCYCFYSRLD
jgi:hypothetical protein